MLLKWFRISILYFVIAGLLGLFLRYIIFSPIEGVTFKYFLHAHSHVAFLGWIFNALFSGLLFAYLPERHQRYKTMFWLLQIAVIGMLLTFPVQGYAAASITFSTLHIFLSWWFAYKFYHDVRGLKAPSLRFVRWGLNWMVLSSIGPFALGYFMSQGFSGNLYNLSIYFYLHFQYNGWFTFAVFGLFFWLLEKNGIYVSDSAQKTLLWLMVISCFLGYALSALWTEPPLWVYILGYIAATLQLVALVYLAWLLKNDKITAIKALLERPVFYLMGVSLLGFVIKVLMQFSAAFPSIANLAYKARNFTIGYLHVVFLGFISIFLMALYFHVFQLGNKKVYRGIVVFLTGFILSEILIFLQPVLLLSGYGLIPFDHQILFFISILMPVGIIEVFVNSVPIRLVKRVF